MRKNLDDKTPTEILELTDHVLINSKSFLGQGEFNIVTFFDSNKDELVDIALTIPQTAAITDYIINNCKEVSVYEPSLNPNDIIIPSNQILYSDLFL